MKSFDLEKKNREDSITDGLIITATTVGIIFALSQGNVNPGKAFLDAIDILKRAGGVCGGVLLKDYAV